MVTTSMAASCISRGLLSLGCNTWCKLSWTSSTLIRCYARGIRRVPINVLTPEETLNFRRPAVLAEAPVARPNPILTDSTKTAKNVKNARKLSPSHEIHDLNVDAVNLATKKRNLTQKDAKPKNENLNKNKPVGEAKASLNIISKKDVAERKLGMVMQTVKSSKSRKASGKLCLEGHRLIHDALQAGAVAEMIFFSNNSLIDELALTNLKSVPELYKVSYKEIQLWSELTTSPGIIGIFKTPKFKELTIKSDSQLPLTLICDNVRDPGNMGSVLRCAAAVGCRDIIVTKGCVDVWDSKVIRAASGAHFRIPITASVEWNMICNYVDDNATVILADSVKEVSQTESAIRKTLLEIEEKPGSTSQIIEVDENTGKTFKYDPSYSDINRLELYSKLPIPSYSYDELKFDPTCQVVLVIGGEAHGISNAARKLAHDCGGIKACIPLANGVESLNLGVAFGVLAFEIRRLLNVSDKSQ